MATNKTTPQAATTRTWVDFDLATKKTTVAAGNTTGLDFDLATFKRQKAQLAQVASAQVAEKIANIKVLISDIRELVELSGMTVKLQQELAYAIDCVDELNPEWNSSSFDC